MIRFTDNTDKIMNNFYVYMYMDKSGIPFYIGKGSGKRFYASNHLHGNNPFLENKIEKIGVDNVKTHFLHENLTEMEAFQFEVFYIKYYGRRGLGKGTLCNLSDGGEGQSGRKGKDSPNYGRKHSEETKRKMSKVAKGKYQGKNNPMYGVHRKGKDAPMYGRKGKDAPMYGKKHSKETRQKISKSLKLYWAKKEN